MLNYDLDRNFLNLPICPIYGSGVIISYLIFDTPKNMRIFNYKIKYNHKNAYIKHPRAQLWQSD